MSRFRRFIQQSSDFQRDDRGAVLIWFTVMLLTIVALIGVALEGARFMNLNSNLQEVADASALAGAKELDGAKGAISRAKDKARNYLANSVTWSDIGVAGSQITADVRFYSSLANMQSDTVTTSDKIASYIKVTTVDRGISTSFKAVSNGSSTVNTSATTTAVSQYVTCAPIQSFACNPYENTNTTTTGDGSSFLGSGNVHIGDMFKLVDGSGNAPGDWGLIQPPGTNGNPNKNQPPWWSLSGTSSCKPIEIGDNELDTSTSPGNTAKFAVEGQNVRFDTPSSTNGVVATSSPIVISGFKISGNTSNFTCSHTSTTARPVGPAPAKLAFKQTNECTSTTECTAPQTAQSTAYDTYCNSAYGSCPFPRDRKFSQLGVGGTWGSMLKGSGADITDLKAYWANHHSGTLPSGINTRYQVYQREVDGSAPFTSASETREPSRPQCTKSKPAGGLERRLINVAIVDCNYWDIKGRKAIPTTTLTARFFMTEPAVAGEGSIYGELVDIMQANVDGGPVHHIVKLVR